MSLLLRSQDILNDKKISFYFLRGVKEKKKKKRLYLVPTERFHEYINPAPTLWFLIGYYDQQEEEIFNGRYNSLRGQSDILFFVRNAVRYGYWQSHRP